MPVFFLPRSRGERMVRHRKMEDESHLLLYALLINPKRSYTNTRHG